MWQYLQVLHLQVNTFFKYWLNTCKYYLNTYKYCHNTCENWAGEYTLRLLGTSVDYFWLEDLTYKRCLWCFWKACLQKILSGCFIFNENQKSFFVKQYLGFCLIWLIIEVIRIVLIQNTDYQKWYLLAWSWTIQRYRLTSV